jgi:hypothetical protein
VTGDFSRRAQFHEVSSVIMLIRLWTGRPRNRRSFLGRGISVFSSPQHPQWIGGPPDLQANEYQLGHETDHSPVSIAEINNGRNCTFTITRHVVTTLPLPGKVMLLQQRYPFYTLTKLY